MVDLDGVRDGERASGAPSRGWFDRHQRGQHQDDPSDASRSASMCLWWLGAGGFLVGREQLMPLCRAPPIGSNQTRAKRANSGATAPGSRKLGQTLRSSTMAMRARQARLGTACKGLSRHRLPLTKLDAFICLVLFVILFKFLFLLAISTNTSGAMCQQQRPAHQASRRSPLEPVAPGSIFDSLLGMSSNKQQQETANQNGNQAAQSNFNDITHMSYRNGQTSDKVTLPGDILLGGLFPIHMKGTKVECGQINRDRGIQRLEAMLYALDRINEDSTLLPDIKLGAILLDSCSSSTYALNQSLEFIRASINTVESSAFECKDKSTPRPKYGSKMIAGVIGGSYSEVSLQVANLLRLFRIPQVSYASTGTALSDKTLYDLFARTVPSDMFQARAIADIVLKLNWSYVSLVSSEGLYGDSGSKEFAKQAANRRICIATHEKISPTIGENAYDSIVANLLKRNATGVVLFTRAEDTRELLLAVKRAKLVHNFAWVAADGWGTHQKLVEGVEEVAWGAITVELQAKAIPGFDQYMKALTPWANGRNPWFSEYWQEWFDCQLEANLVQQQRLASGAPYNRRRFADMEKRKLASPSAQARHRHDNNNANLGQTTGRPRRSTADQTNGGAGGGGPLKGCQMGARSASRRHLAGAPEVEQRANGTQCLEPARAGPSAAPPAATSGGLRPRRSVAGELTLEESQVKQFCSPNLRISESNGYRQEQKVQFVVDAVYAMAHALHKAWSHLCDAQPGVVCEALKELNGGEFYNKYLLNVSFKDLAGSEVKFDEHGDGLGRYNIYNFRQVRPQSAPPNRDAVAAAAAAAPNDSIAELDLLGGGSPDAAPIDKLGGVVGASFQQEKSTNGGQQTVVEHIYTSNVEFEYSSIGRWTEDDYYLALDEIQFFQGDHLVPESYCSRPCELGQAKIMRAGDHCCWICKTCQPYEFLPDEFNCQDCGIGRWPVPNKTSCYDLPQKYLRWDSVYSLISLSIACLGIALTLFVSIIFIKYLDTPVVKASGRELSFILLAGIACCHLSTFVLLSKPTTFICGSQRFLVNFGFALMYASLLVKTNRISRIFNCARKSAKRPSFISPKSQMLITGILVAIQIFLTIVWFVFEPPGIRADSPEGKRDEVILKCRAKGKSFIISLVYNMILITTCTVYAVKTRKIPENFNESKFIGFTMYTTIVIWLAFVTMFFGTNNSYEIQINTMCVCISLSAYVTLFCLFSPKISIILLHPDKNVRKLTMNSATYKRAFKPVSSVASVDGRNNLTSGGAQQDAVSGGPMSTTSNVPNLAESQNARLLESSIVSNVMNSNSAGSNCSQKTPTTLSQQLALVGVCTNCGAHQLASLPTATNMIVSRTSTNRHVTSGGETELKGGHVSSNKESDRWYRQQQCPSATNRINTTPSSTHVGQLMNQSSILVGSAMSNNSGRPRQSTSAAKVLHNKIPPSASPHPSGSATKYPLGKRIPSDELVHQADIHQHQHHHHHHHHQQQQNHCHSNNLNSEQQKISSNNKKQIASLSRLNEMTSITSSDKHYIDDSISSLVNDSFMNTSQENTPCNNGVGDHSTHGIGHSQCKESDSMLCNQSVQSIDYCSECCPSLCQCSCPICSSNGGEDGNIALCEHAHSTTALKVDENDGEGNDYDAMCILQLVHRDDYTATSTMRDFNSAGTTSIRRRKSEEPGATVSSSVKNRGRGSCRTGEVDDGGPKARRSQTMEMYTIMGTDHSSQRARQSFGLPACASDSIEIAKTTNRSTLKGSSRSQQQHVATTSKPTAYAIQAAATSALGAAAAQVSLAAAAAAAAHNSSNGQATLPSCTMSYPQQQHQPAAVNQNFQLASYKDKFGSEKREPGDGENRQSRWISTHMQQHEQHQQQQQQQMPSVQALSADGAGGTIQASLEMVKLSEARRKCMDAASRHRKSGCFNYHDEYEYSYGLVHSNSDSERDCYYDEDDGATDAYLVPGGDSSRDNAESSPPPARALTDYDTAYDYDDDGDAGDEDDFEHDGRVTLDRQQSKSAIRRRSSSSRHGRKGSKSRLDKQRAKERDFDEHRINSVTLITATLSAGGAIVDSGSSNAPTEAPDHIARQQQQQYNQELVKAAGLNGQQQEPKGSA